MNSFSDSEAPDASVSGVGEVTTSEPQDIVMTESSESGSQVSPPLVDDDAVSIADSGFGGMSVASSTSSLRSSIYEVEELHGRTYHGFKQGKYPLPNDEEELERLDLQHALWAIALQGEIALAPFEEESLLNVLDIGTGTGIWAIEFAQKYPKAQVLGTDLSTIQPLYVPPNLRFEIEDAEDEWVFSTKFDYVHGRALTTCFEDHSFVIGQAFNSLEPGGYLELQDIIFPIQYLGPAPVDSALYKWSQLVVDGANKTGRPWDNVQHYKRWFEEAGFEDVVEKKFFWPTSGWAKGEYFKQIAAYCQADFMRGVEGLSLKTISQLGWDTDKIKEFCVDVRKDLQDTNIHAYVGIRVVYGRKPKSQKT